jgi:hypothetical protein
MKYRKKPVVIEAIQWTGSHESAQEINDWNNKQFWTIKDDRRMMIPTLEGTMAANPGDYIIKGVNGEFYPCKPDVFRKTYDPVYDDDFKVGGTE